MSVEVSGGENEISSSLYLPWNKAAGPFCRSLFKDPERFGTDVGSCQLYVNPRDSSGFLTVRLNPVGVLLNGNIEMSTSRMFLGSTMYALSGAATELVVPVVTVTVNNAQLGSAGKLVFSVSFSDPLVKVQAGKSWQLCSNVFGSSALSEMAFLNADGTRSSSGSCEFVSVLTLEGQLPGTTASLQTLLVTLPRTSPIAVGTDISLSSTAFWGPGQIKMQMAAAGGSVTVESLSTAQQAIIPVFTIGGYVPVSPHALRVALPNKLSLDGFAVCQEIFGRNQFRMCNFENSALALELNTRDDATKLLADSSSDANALASWPSDATFDGGRILRVIPRFRNTAVLLRLAQGSAAVSVVQRDKLNISASRFIIRNYGRELSILLEDVPPTADLQMCDTMAAFIFV